MLISNYELQGITIISSGIRYNLRADLILSNIYDTEVMRVDSEILIQDNKIIFKVWVERISSGNMGLIKNFSIERSLLKTPKELGFVISNYLMENLKEIT